MRLRVYWFRLRLSLIGQSPPAHGQVQHGLAGCRIRCAVSQTLACDGPLPVCLRSSTDRFHHCARLSVSCERERGSVSQPPTPDRIVPAMAEYGVAGTEKPGPEAA
jgi:hypothetical protein